MKKIVLIGKITDFYRQTNKKLIEKFEVKTCANQIEIFKRIMEVNKPDAVVIVFDTWTDKEENLMREMHTNFSRTPVVRIDAAIEGDVVEMVELAVEGNGPILTDFLPDKLLEQFPFKETILEDLVKSDSASEDKGKNESGSKAKSKDVPVQETEKKSILLVDDSGIYLRTLKGLIGDAYDVQMTTSGLNVLTKIQQKRPDLILLDYEMPMYDGKQTMISIRESELGKDIPIVFVTAVNRAENIKAVLRLKPDGYLLKPVDKDRLMQTIKDIIGE